MSDAREVVQPRWKRRATEIAEAIGGNSAGVSSVSLDSNTITQLSQAIADAIDLKVLDINIKAYDNDLVSSAGLPIRTGTGPVTGGFLPLRVVTDIGDKVDMNIVRYNGSEVDSRGLPVQAGRTTSTNVTVPLVVNCPTVNNFPTGSGGTTNFPSTMDVNIVKFGGGPNISASAHLPITGFVDCRQDTGSARPWIVSTGVQGSNTLGQWGNTTLSVTETNPVSGSALTGTVDVNIKEYDGTAVNTTGLPFKQGWAPGTNSREVIRVAEQNIVSVDLASGLGSTGLTAIPVTVSGTVATTETSPVTTVSVDNHPTTTTITGSVAVQPALDANNVAIPLSVTETNPVSGGGGGGGGGGTSLTQLEVETAVGNALANATGISVTETAAVRDVKIVGDETTGTIMTKIYPYGPNTSNGNFSSSEMYVGQAYGAHGQSTGLQTFNIQQSVQQLGVGYNPAGGDINTGWIIRCNGVDIYNQDITFGIVAHAGSNATPTIYANIIEITGQDVIDKYHGRKVTLSSVANVWIIQPTHDYNVIEGHILGKAVNPSGSTAYIWRIRSLDGTIFTYQRVYNNGSVQYDADSVEMYGARVINYGVDKWFVEVIDAI